MLDEYKPVVESLETTWNEFKEAADAGAEGRGCKTSALKARKLSMKLTEELKEFRKTSISNDRSN